jgi:glucose-1-phosphate thymidylyltransferase
MAPEDPPDESSGRPLRVDPVDRPLRVLLLAAGWATRLGAVSRDRPKHLLPLGDRTPLDRLVDRADALAGLRAIDVWTNEAFRPAFEAWARGRATRAPLQVWGNEAHRLEERRGAVGDIQAYLERVEPRETLLVLGADNVFDSDLAALAATAHREPVVHVFDVGTRERASRYASVVLSPTGTIARMVEKDPAPPSSLAVTALYGLPVAELPSVAVYLAEGGSADRMGSFMEWLAARRPVRALPLEGRWIDIGSADELERARNWFARGNRPPAC